MRRRRDDPEDYAAMARWLSDPRVLEFYGGRDDVMKLESVVAKCGGRLADESTVEPRLIVSLDRPVGYVQLYRIDDQPDEPRRADFPGDRDAWALDLFVGEPELWGSGLGTRVLSLVVASLFAERGATSVSVDPWVGNARAIRAYEKAGFRKVRLLARNELHEGEPRDAWLMVARPEPAT